MGICLSCLKARDKGRSAQDGETQPLLAGSADGGDNDGAGEENDEQSLARQQELANIVQATQELFIDVSGIPNTDAGAEHTGDLSELSAQITERESGISLSIPEVQDLTSDDQRQIQHDIEAMARKNASPPEVSQAS